MDGAGLDGAGVRVETNDDESIAFVTCELDITGAQRLRDAIERMEHPSSQSGKPVRVVLELSECSFMDSSGLSVLIGTHKRLADAQIELVLRQPVEKVFRVLDMTGMTNVFTIER